MKLTSLNRKENIVLPVERPDKKEKKTFLVKIDIYTVLLI
jgi:hypothetical protein